MSNPGSITSSPTPGRVYITGAGPGDPELITLKGIRVLREADVIVYDRLANPELLAHSRSDSEHIYVGKRPDKPSVSQAQINSILISKAQAGRIVVRLKGGDPFIFGRGGEECEALVAEGIPFEVIPGISSSMAAPAYAGIPLTHRNYGRSFAVVTGHTADHQGHFENWEHLSHIDTLVVLMGLKHLPQIMQTLQKHGRSPDTPVTLIENATLSRQRTCTATLGTIAEKTVSFNSPATVVIGELAAMTSDLAWFQRLEVESSSATANARIQKFAI